MPYKRTVKKFRSLQITASVLFLYFFIKAYVVGIAHLNIIALTVGDLEMIKGNILTEIHDDHINK